MFVVVVLDTNQWFHSTVILGINFSIAIGSEYDWCADECWASVLCILLICFEHKLHCEGVQAWWCTVWCWTQSRAWL